MILIMLLCTSLEIFAAGIKYHNDANNSKVIGSRTLSPSSSRTISRTSASESSRRGARLYVWRSQWCNNYSVMVGEYGPLMYHEKMWTLFPCISCTRYAIFCIYMRSLNSDILIGAMLLMTFKTDSDPLVIAILVMMFRLSLSLRRTRFWIWHGLLPNVMVLLCLKSV